MILANFDLSFFTSIPGMLITGGVLLLLIALIIFIATGSKKDKKGKKEETSNTETTDAVTTTMPTVDNNITTEPVVMAPTNPQVTEEVPTVNATSLNTQATVENAPEEVIVNPIEPIVSQEETPQIPVVQPEVSMKVEPVIPKNEEVEVPTPINNVEQVTPIVSTPVSSPNQEVADAPTITIVDKEEEKPQVEVPTPHEEPKAIYGGASPVIPKIEVPGEQHRPIYGGANPLENTGAIPTINSQGMPNANSATQIIDTKPQVETVEKISVTAPQVEVPTIESPKVEVPKQEVVTPTVIEQTSTQQVSSISKNEEEIESLF